MVSQVLTVLKVLLLRRRREGHDLPFHVRERLSFFQGDPGHLLLLLLGGDRGREEAHPLEEVGEVGGGVGKGEGGAAEDTLS